MALEKESNKMGNFQFQWWTIDVTEPTGRITWEVKAKDKDKAVRQIEKWKKDLEVELSAAGCAFTVVIFWDTLTLDRVSYQRRF